jgi:hypothetical protein
MKYRILIALAVALIVGAQPSIGFAGEKLTLYKNPTCTCCEIYAQYMRDNGFDVTVIPTHDLATLSEEHGIPTNMQACHISLIGDYAIGGHVPVDIVKRPANQGDRDTRYADWGPWYDARPQVGPLNDLRHLAKWRVERLCDRVTTSFCRSPRLPASTIHHRACLAPGGGGVSCS